MEITSDISTLRSLVSDARKSGKTIACVPTMGALHCGHLSLVQHSRNYCQQKPVYIVLTIFVNPKQFTANEDLDKYPKTLDQDLSACRSVGVDCVFIPNTDSLYAPDFDTWVTVSEQSLSGILEGQYRPSFFRGVTTIVLKLFNIVQPDIACLGAKDYQQQIIVRKMVNDLNVNVKILVCPTVRDSDGLAMSSRNVFLGADQRLLAVKVYETLELAAKKLTEMKQNSDLSIESIEKEMTDYCHNHSIVTQYCVLRNGHTLNKILDPISEPIVALIAVFVGNTRLIDSLVIQ